MRSSKGQYLKTHGGSHTYLYNIWAQMLGRCLNPRNKNYPNYGERGITVCERWLSFANFRHDVGDRPTPAHSFDRINPDGNYSPGNCRWATMEVQIKNRRKYKAITNFTTEELTSELARRGYEVTVTKKNKKFFD